MSCSPELCFRNFSCFTANLLFGNARKNFLWPFLCGSIKLVHQVRPRIPEFLPCVQIHAFGTSEQAIGSARGTPEHPHKYKGHAQLLYKFLELIDLLQVSVFYLRYSISPILYLGNWKRGICALMFSAGHF